MLGSRCLLGRHPACDLQVDNPRVSAEHASVRWVDDRWELRDLGSRNGTFVDGRRLGPGERWGLFAGATFSLGGEVELILADDAPPVASARHAKTGAIRFATDGILVLPEEDRPEVSIFEDAGGRWIADHGDEARVVRDHDVVVADGEGWILDLPSTAGPTWEAGVFAPTLETITLRFAVSRTEEHIELTMVHEDKVTRLPPRSHYYLLLTLARARLGDEAATSGERGWVDRDELCRMLGTEPGMLNVDVFRARRQLATMGVHGAAGIVARRPGTGQLRLGTDRVEIAKL
ncbi:MAG: FHA domain-containing protein [Minicystis sp.]